MDVVGSDKAPQEAPIAEQLIRISLVATIIVIAFWAVANYALDLLVTTI